MKPIHLYILEHLTQPTAYLMVGIPGAGKSTWIEENLPEDINIISRDKIRVEIGMAKNVDDKRVGTHEEEAKITHIENDYIKKAVANGETFVIDDTNYRRKYRRKTIKLLRELGVHIIAVNLNTPVETCIKRREGQVDPEIMNDIAKKFMPVSDDEDVDEIINVD